MMMVLLHEQGFPFRLIRPGRNFFAAALAMSFSSWDALVHHPVDPSPCFVEFSRREQVWVGHQLPGKSFLVFAVRRLLIVEIVELQPTSLIKRYSPPGDIVTGRLHFNDQGHGEGGEKVQEIFITDPCPPAPGSDCKVLGKDKAAAIPGGYEPHRPARRFYLSNTIAVIFHDLELALTASPLIFKERVTVDGPESLEINL
jgi:hypothetical protein